MKCHNCSNAVPSNLTTCPTCGLPLQTSLSYTVSQPPRSATQGVAAQQSASTGPQATKMVPLTRDQRTYLTLVVTLLPAAVGILSFVWYHFGLIEDALRPGPLGLLFTGALIYAIIKTAITSGRAARDLISGEATEITGHLERVWAKSRKGSGSSSSIKCYAEFEDTGPVSVFSRQYLQLLGQEGRRYRVIYSPASRNCWSAEPIASTAENSQVPPSYITHSTH